MRILGLDFGQKRIGVALSDVMGMTAQPLTVIQRQGLSVDIEALALLIEQNAAETVVMGLPLTPEGKKGAQAQRVEAFANALKQVMNVPIAWVDERFTTAQGSRALSETGESHRSQKGRIDQVAAQLILQSYLDTRNAQKNG